MKNAIYAILTVAALCAACSCQKNNGRNAGNGNLTLLFECSQPFDVTATATKGSLSDLSESIVSDMRIFVAQDGKIIADEVFNSSNCASDISAISGSAWKKSAEGVGKGLVKLDLESAAEGPVNIYAIANCASANLELPQTMEDEDDIFDVIIKLKEQSVSRYEPLVMTSVITGADPAGITESIGFRRLDAKVLVKIECANQLSFDPMGWSVDGVPFGVAAFSADTVCEPFSSEKGMFDGRSFTFYTLPTQKEVQVNIFGDLTSSNSRSEISYAFSFEPKSNTMHTCTVTIEGVSSIRVNVEEDTESDSQYKGAITDITTGGVQIIADAHYESRVISIDKSLLKDEMSDCIVSTTDTNWVSFMFNKVDESGNYIQEAQSYPGFGSKALFCPVDLYSALKEAYAEPSGRIYLTAFIDENFHDDQAWNIQTNKEPRTMSLLCNRKFNEKTGNSVVTAMISIVQHSVQSVYVSGCQATWGVECINESKAIPYDSTSVEKNIISESFSNGRRNSLVEWGFVKASGVVYTPRNWAELKSKAESYRRYACINRNRDENGDGVIDVAELKWYTASEEQLVMLWIGNEVIYAGSRVDPQNPVSSFRCVRNLNMGDVSNSNPNVNYEPQKVVSYNSGTFDANNLSRSAMRRKTEKELEQNFEYEESNRLSSGFVLASKNTSAAKQSIATINAKVNAGNKVCPDGYRLPNQRELMLMSYFCKSELNGSVSLCRTLYSARLEGDFYSWIWDGSFNRAERETQSASFRCVKDK